MNEQALREKLDSLLREWEGECAEFKEANDNFPLHEIGKYFSALSNEANLHSREAAWLVFGVNNKRQSVIGTSFRVDRERLNSLKQQIAQDTDPSTTFREIHEVAHPLGRILMFEIPPAPRGIPIGWKGHYYARNGESLDGLHFTKQDEIRAQGAEDDWSAVVCPNATIDDLDGAALRKAREVFAAKHSGRIPELTIQGWDDKAFLDKAKLAIDGQITRATLLLLGSRESTHHLTPFVAGLSWKLEGEERAYEHFSPPFLLTTSLLYQRIRNLRVTLLPAGQLVPLELGPTPFL